MPTPSLPDIPRSLKENVRAVSTGNLSIVGAVVIPTIDLVTLAPNDRVLLTGQTVRSQNGLWVVSVASGSTGTFTRPADMQNAEQLKFGCYVKVQEGEAYGGSFWHLSNLSLGSIVIDTTSQDWGRIGVNPTWVDLVGTFLSKAENIRATDTPISDQASIIQSNILYIAGQTVVPSGRTVRTIGFLSGTTIATPTHYWFCLIDPSGLKTIRSTGDQLTTPWPANTLKTLNLTTPWVNNTAAGYGTDKVVFVGIMVSGTVPSLTGISYGSTQAGNIPINRIGNSTISMTTPVVDAFALTAITPNTKLPYWVIS